METMNHADHTFPLVTQIQNNTTIWIGHLQTDPTDHFAGQTFKCPISGELNNIQLYSSAVQYPGGLTLSLHSFDPENKAWGPQLVFASVDIQKRDEEKWIRFDLQPMPLHQDEDYGFRIHANNSMIALGEAVTGSTKPFDGEEWHGNSGDLTGHYYRYFSLAFKVEICA